MMAIEKALDQVYKTGQPVNIDWLVLTSSENSGPSKQEKTTRMLSLNIPSRFPRPQISPVCSSAVCSSPVSQVLYREDEGESPSEWSETQSTLPEVMYSWRRGHSLRNESNLTFSFEVYWFREAPWTPILRRAASWSSIRDINGEMTTTRPEQTTSR